VAVSNTHHLHEHCVANRLNAAPAIKADVVGRSCYGDRLLGAVRLLEIEIGDVFRRDELPEHLEPSEAPEQGVDEPGRSGFAGARMRAGR